MGLIINKQLPMFKVGYPTVSDKYNVQGGILESGSVNFGELVMFGTKTGYYKPVASAVSVDDIAGFVLATNVKQPNNWPGTEVKVNAGEAFNLVLNGYLAVKLAADAVESKVKANSVVAVNLSNGALSTSGVANYVDMDYVVFTGIYEKDASGAIIAEIRVL